MNFNQDTRLVRSAINSISSCFCAAKWLQTTLHLHDGFTHSCYHPHRHKIPLQELSENIDALHNTKFKMAQQQLMLKGERPTECSYCWKIEDLPGSPNSDRHIKSGEHWAWPHLSRLAFSKPTDRINPSYLEVSFSTACNMKCSYCSPAASSAWRQDLKQKGPHFGGLENYHSAVMAIPTLEESANPYIKAFWEWWPDLSKTLAVFRVTGGEPLLSHNTWKIFDMLEATPQLGLEFDINSNMMVPTDLIERLITRVNDVLPNIQCFMLYTSVDTFGPDAEYARNGLNWNQFTSNIANFMEKVKSSEDQVKLCFMITYSIFSSQSFGQFLRYILEIKKKYANPGVRIFIDPNYLEGPEFLGLKVLDDRYLKTITADNQFMVENQPWFNTIEIEKHQRIVRIMKHQAVDPRKQAHLRRDFEMFIHEHDLRRGTNFKAIFPTLSDLIP